MEKQDKPTYGGQAVIEGVMFSGSRTTVTAIRRKDGSLEYFEVPKYHLPLLTKLQKIPFVRGIINILEANATGNKHLKFATDRFNIHPKDDNKLLPKESSSKLSIIFGVATVGILSFLFGKFILTIIPVIGAESLRFLFPGHIIQNLLEGFIKLLLLLGYVYFISLIPLIQRVCQYHGAEHKVMNAYEQGLPLTTENVQNQSRLHYRCGSSFILFTVIVSVFIYLLVPFDTIWERILHRIALLPLILGVSYEVLQLTNKMKDIPLLNLIGYPGLWLQHLTTKEPNNEQVDTAIQSFKEMLNRDRQYTFVSEKDTINNNIS